MSMEQPEEALTNNLGTEIWETNSSGMKQIQQPNIDPFLLCELRKNTIIENVCADISITVANMFDIYVKEYFFFLNKYFFVFLKI